VRSPTVLPRLTSLVNWPRFDRTPGMSREALPPAVHPSGGEYRWILGCGPGEISPPRAPSWFQSARPAQIAGCHQRGRGGRRR
jgi:hypothetical protein